MSFNFPANPTQGQEYTPIPNGLTYVYINTQWVVKDQDAPNDGKTYGRKNKLGQEVLATSYPDAPPDGKTYGRKNNEWDDIASIDGDLTVSGHILPTVNNTYDVGSPSLRWRTVYVGDLSLRNEHGDWTIVEGEDDLFITNNRTGKRYRFVLQEVD